MSESEADKKRNKLGYQRISIACGHCRRRKIRCVMAENDAQSRCQNCIRLKKDCVFYPVDQQTVVEKAPSSSSSSKTASASLPSSAIVQSPSEMAAGRPFEHRNRFTNIPSVPSNASHGFPGLLIEPGSAFQGQGSFASHLFVPDLTDDGAGHLGGTEFGFQPQEFIARQWSGAGDLSPQTQAAMAGPVGGSRNPYWSTNATNDLGPAFGSNEPSNAVSPDSRSYSFSEPEAGQPWQQFPQQQQQQQQQQQGRSMSYGTLEAIPSSYMPQNNAYGLAHTQPMGESSYAPPHLDMQSAGALQAMPGPHSAPIGGSMHGNFGHPQQQYLFPPGQNISASATVPSQATGPGEWFQHPSGYGQFSQDLDSASDVSNTTRPPR